MRLTFYISKFPVTYKRFVKTRLRDGATKEAGRPGVGRMTALYKFPPLVKGGRGGLKNTIQGGEMARVFLRRLSQKGSEKARRLSIFLDNGKEVSFVLLLHDEYILKGTPEAVFLQFLGLLYPHLVPPYGVLLAGEVLP